MNTLLNTIKKFYPEVEQVKDSTKNLRVVVTKKDINLTAVKKHKDCAIAVACRNMPEYDGAVVGISRAYLIKGKTAIRFDVPQSAAREITTFDRSGLFEPGEYQLTKPSVKLGHHKGPGPRVRESRTHGKFRHITENIRETLNK